VHGVGVDVGGVGMQALSIHELIQHGWNIGHARLHHSPRRCQMLHGHRSLTRMVGVA